jgi:hypothetical protein
VVRLDIWDARVGANVVTWLEDCLKEADRILLVPLMRREMRMGAFVDGVSVTLAKSAANME